MWVNWATVASFSRFDADALMCFRSSSHLTFSEAHTFFYDGIWFCSLKPRPLQYQPVPWVEVVRCVCF